MTKATTAFDLVRESGVGQAKGLPAPYLLFLGDVTDPRYAKTAFGLRDWSPERCIGEMTTDGSRFSLGLRRLSPAEARLAGAQALVIGIANSGGVIPDCWVPALIEALEAGLDLVSGLHTRLGDVPAIAAAAKRTGRQLIDIRTPPAYIPVGTGRKRNGRRLLTVGTDCALGKKYTALAIARGLQQRGHDAKFRATGQTGIMIAGEGLPMDAVVADFLAGAAEMLSPDAAPDHIDVIEGQGSLFHPAYAAVTLGLLHGSQPDLFVVCHSPERKTILGLDNLPVPTIAELIAVTITMGRMTNPNIRCAGISLNTFGMPDEDAERVLDAIEKANGLPVADPVRGGLRFERLLDSCT